MKQFGWRSSPDADFASIINPHPFISTSSIKLNVLVATGVI
jgi:hypothetical protein